MSRDQLNLRDLQSLYWSTEQAEKDLLPLLLFRGHSTLGQVQATWNLTRVLRKSGVESLADAGRFAADQRDVVHSAGVHNAAGLPERLWRLTNRVFSCPSGPKIDSDTAEYLRFLMARSKRLIITTLMPIDRYSPWSKQAWRKPVSQVIGPNEPLNPSWPFMPTGAGREKLDGAELLLAVDALVPPNLPAQVREDVCQDLVLAVLEGELTAAELKDRDVYMRFVRDVFRRYPIKYGRISLDQPPPWDPHGRTLGETLTYEDVIS